MLEHATHWLLVALCVTLAAVCGIILAATKRPRDNLAVLAGASAGFVDMQVYNVHVATLLFAAWGLTAWRERTHRLLAQPAFLMGASSLVAVTVLFGPLVSNKGLGLQLLLLAGSAAIVMLAAHQRDITRFIHGLLITSTISSSIGLLQVAGALPNENWRHNVSSIGRPVGLQPEPDWLGLFAGVSLILSWRLLHHRWLRTGVIAINGSAFVLAFARSAWIGVLVSAALVAVASTAGPGRRRRSRKGRIAPVAALAFGLLVLTYANPTFRADLTQRLEGTVAVQETDVSGQARILQKDSLLELARTSPWYGQGLSASGRVGVSGRITYGAATNSVASDWILALWVDGRFLAVPLLALFVFTAVRRSIDPIGQCLLAALISNLFSNATFFPITWLLLAAASIGVEAGPPSSKPGMDYASQPLGPAQIPLTSITLTT